jgi:hypothetical protein
MAFTPGCELSAGYSSETARESLSREASVWTSRPHQSAPPRRRFLSPFRSCTTPAVDRLSVKALAASRSFRRSACARHSGRRRSYLVGSLVINRGPHDEPRQGVSLPPCQAFGSYGESSARSPRRRSRARTNSSADAEAKTSFERFEDGSAPEKDAG